MLMGNPLISIIIPCYNQAQYLPETLQSVMEQVYPNWECLIVNDGSPDNTEEIALDWCRKDTRFRYLSKPNGGLSDTRNFGIKHSSGKYIQVLDSDDKVSSDYSKEAIEILEQNQNVKLVSCKVMLFGDDSGVCEMLPYTYENLLFKRNCFYHSCIYRRSDYDKTIGYNTNMKKGWEDYDFWISLLDKNDKVITLNKVHFYYRTKAVSMRTLISLEDEAQLRIQIFKNHIDKYLAEINPIEQYKELQKFKLIENSTQYRLGGHILAPFRLVSNLFRKKK